MRLPANGKYWIKRARVRFDAPVDEAPGFIDSRGADGTVLADLRIEEGRIRAILPAGTAPCCSPGIDLEGGRAAMADSAGLAPGLPADLELEGAGGTALRLVAGEVRSLAES